LTEYDRPHLSFADQVALMEARGLDCSDCDAARALAKVGYYRLSAYTYPFRELLGPNDQAGSPVQFRAAEFSPGYKLIDALALYDFDHGLRALCAEALKAVEVGLRVQVAYVLGERNRFGHLERSALDEDACSETAPDNEGDMFDYWTRRYLALKRQAQSEDFVRHYILKYDGRLPVWVAVETLDFGGVIRLFSLLNRNDQNTIARSWGVKDGRRLHKWLLALGTLRNHCAHHSRLWNRNLTYAIGQFAPAIVGAELAHVARHPHPKKLYPALAILAYLTVRIDPKSNWPRSLKTKVKKKFPAISGLSPESDMGFPASWADEALWNYEPQS
jgi:abortive infection bacteriophage resistance protein